MPFAETELLLLRSYDSNRLTYQMLIQAISIWYEMVVREREGQSLAAEAVPERIIELEGLLFRILPVTPDKDAEVSEDVKHALQILCQPKIQDDSREEPFRRETNKVFGAIASTSTITGLVHVRTGTFAEILEKLEELRSRGLSDYKQVAKTLKCLQYIEAHDALGDYKLSGEGYYWTKGDDVVPIHFEGFLNEGKTWEETIQIYRAIPQGVKLAYISAVEKNKVIEFFGKLRVGCCINARTEEALRWRSQLESTAGEKFVDLMERWSSRAEAYLKYTGRPVILTEVAECIVQRYDGVECIRDEQHCRLGVIHQRHIKSFLSSVLRLNEEIVSASTPISLPRRLPDNFKVCCFGRTLDEQIVAEKIAEKRMSLLMAVREGKYSLALELIEDAQVMLVKPDLDQVLFALTCQFPQDDEILLQAQVARKLLEQGANPDGCCSRIADDSLLHKAILRKNIALAQLLLEYGADLGAKGGRGETTALDVAIELKNYAFVLDVIASVKVQLRPSTLNRALFALSRQPPETVHGSVDDSLQIQVARELLEKRANPIGYCSSISKNTSLHEAARNKNIALVKLFFEYGADVNLVTQDGETVLDIAIYIDAYELAWVIIEATQTELRMETLNQALLVLSRQLPPQEIQDSDEDSLQVRIARRLLDIGKVKSDYLRRLSLFDPFCEAIMKKNIALVKLFFECVEFGIEVNNRNKDGKTPLELAIEAQDYEIAELIIERAGALLTLISLRLALLALSCQPPQEVQSSTEDSSQIRVARKLLNRRVHPDNCSLFTKNTCLHEVVLRKNIALVRLFLEYNADVCKPNNTYITPLRLLADWDLDKDDLKRLFEVAREKNITSLVYFCIDRGVEGYNLTEFRQWAKDQFKAPMTRELLVSAFRYSSSGWDTDSIDWTRISSQANLCLCLCVFFSLVILCMASMFFEVNVILAAAAFVAMNVMFIVLQSDKVMSYVFPVISAIVLGPFFLVSDFLRGIHKVCKIGGWKKLFHGESDYERLPEDDDKSMPPGSSYRELLPILGPGVEAVGPAVAHSIEDGVSQESRDGEQGKLPLSSPGFRR
jgi:ankyrin repeat protein